ncbi:hypothetical protein C0J45_8652 [Silurus meridionalis]|nr:hypothetical protein C0J45_8652 [Silurus meridionalis]
MALLLLLLGGRSKRGRERWLKKNIPAVDHQRKKDKETWWWNEKVQKSIRGKRFVKQKWDGQSDEKSRQEHKEMRQQVKRDLAKAKEKAYEELYERLNTKGGEKDLYRLARQRDRAGKDVLQVRAIKDGDGNVLTSKENVLRRWREYFEQLMNEKNQRERRLDNVELLKQEVDRIMVMDRLTDEIRQESPWTMMFADDIVICGESREQVEKSLEGWRYMLEKRGMKVSRSKTEYMCVNERKGSGEMRLQGEEVEKVEAFSIGGGGETKWKGIKARNIRGGFKLFYHGVDGKRNGVGVILKEEYSKSVVEVKRVSDRVMIVKVEVEGMMMNVISVYAPQVGCEMEEKERFWSELDEVVDGVPRKERLVIGADFNGHVGEGNRGDEEVMGRYGFKNGNMEGQMVVDFAKRMEMAVVNTYFKKKEDHRVTYKSGGRCTPVDYVLCRRCNLKEIGDCKVLAGDSAAKQHRMVVCRMVSEVKKKRRTKRRIRWWKLKEEDCSVRFREEVRQRLGGGEEILEKIVPAQLCSHLQENNIFEEFQSGFRPHHSTETALVKITNDLFLASDQGFISLLVLLDLSAAFDNIDQDLLLDRLQNYIGIQRQALSWFKSYLSNRYHFVDLNGELFRLMLVNYGVPQETVALSKRLEAELEVAELKMLRFSLGVTRMDKIRNEFIRGTAHVGCFGDTVREARLRWFGHVQRRDMNYIGRRMLKMEPPGGRKRGRPRRRFMDVVREDMQVVGVKEADVEDRVVWRRMIRCGNP